MILVVASTVDGSSLSPVHATAARVLLAQPGSGSPPSRPRERSLPPHANASAPGVLILDRNLPDPAVLDAHGRYYLYSSQTGFDTPPASVTISDGGTIFHWGQTGAALRAVPAWAETGFTWAPDVRFIAGRYVMYFNAWVVESWYFEPKWEGFSQRAQCIGVATAGDPGGPFTPVARSPLVCQLNHHGAIDPRTFVAPDGRLYLDWKSDDNADPSHPPTHLWAQELSADGLHLVGRRFMLMSGRREVWNGGLIEAPDMVYADHKYWLFYSGSWFNTAGYAIGVARCSGPGGPCRPISGRPWLASNSQGAGPGEESLFHNSRGWWIVYNPWSLYVHEYRSVEVAKVYFGPSGPYLERFAP
jgi:beta-xylosidase